MPIGDGILDIYDTDADGIPDFLDLDSDNDGLADAVEANNGILPSTAFDAANLRYESGGSNDIDGDGLMAAIDNQPARSAVLLQ